MPTPECFVASDGYGHAWRHWPAVGPSRGLLIALHGIQSHSGWYGYSSSLFAENGFAAAYLDRRGAGANQQGRGDSPHPDRLVADVLQFTAHARRQYSSTSGCWLMATSWGAKLALLAAARRPDLFDGIILQSPAIRTWIRARLWQRTLLAMASRGGQALRPISVPLNDPALFCDDPCFQEFIHNDPLALRRATVRFLAGSVEIDRRLPRALATIRLPILLLRAGEDRIMDGEASERALAACPSLRKTFFRYESACHTFEFASNRDEIFADQLDWLNDATRRRARRSSDRKEE